MLLGRSSVIEMFIFYDLVYKLHINSNKISTEFSLEDDKLI